MRDFIRNHGDGASIVLSFACKKLAVFGGKRVTSATVMNKSNNTVWSLNGVYGPQPAVGMVSKYNLCMRLNN